MIPQYNNLIVFFANNISAKISLEANFVDFKAYFLSILS